MLILSSTPPETAGARIAGRFRGTELPPERVRVNAGPASPAGTPLPTAQTGTKNSPEHQSGDDADGFLHDPEDCLVPDARAGLTPSDMVTRRLSEMLYPVTFVVEPWVRPGGETRKEVQAQDSAQSSEGTDHARPGPRG